MLMKKVKRNNILLIDDDEVSHILIEEYLKDTNYNLIATYNGYDGIAKYRETKIDVVLLDINMPVMDGYETLKKLKEIDYSVDVIMCTSDIYSYDRVYKDGAIGYIVKPFSKEKLLSIIDMICKLQKVL